MLLGQGFPTSNPPASPTRGALPATKDPRDTVGFLKNFPTRASGFAITLPELGLPTSPTPNSPLIPTLALPKATGTPRRLAHPAAAPAQLPPPPSPVRRSLTGPFLRPPGLDMSPAAGAAAAGLRPRRGARGRRAGRGRRRGAAESPQRPGLGPEQPAPRPPRPEGPGCAERRRHEPRRERDAELPPPPTSPSSARAAQQSGSRGRPRRLRPRPRRPHAAASAFPSSRLGEAQEPTALVGRGGRCSAAPEQDSGLGRFLLHPPSCLREPGPGAAAATRRLQGAGRRREAGPAGRGLGGRARAGCPGRGGAGRGARGGLGAGGEGLGVEFAAAEGPTQNLGREQAKEQSGGAELCGTRRGLGSSPLKGELLSGRRRFHLLDAHCVQGDLTGWGEHGWNRVRELSGSPRELSVAGVREETLFPYRGLLQIRGVFCSWYRRCHLHPGLTWWTRSGYLPAPALFPTVSPRIGD